jgi:hypothetical protein
MVCEGMSMARAVSGTRQARSILHASASLHCRAKAQDFKACNPSRRHLQPITATFLKSMIEAEMSSSERSQKHRTSPLAYALCNDARWTSNPLSTKKEQC